MKLVIASRRRHRWLEGVHVEELLARQRTAHRAAARIRIEVGDVELGEVAGLLEQRRRAITETERGEVERAFGGPRALALEARQAGACVHHPRRRGGVDVIDRE
jgi:hypothetical protein